MMKILQIIIYGIFQLIFLPTTLIAVAILNYKALVISKKYKVDYTAEKVLQLRCKMHLLGLRRDIESIALYKALPVASFISLQFLAAPNRIAKRITGFRTKSIKIPNRQEASIFDYIFVRTLEFDRILEQNINNIEQVVVLGAGYDLRSLKQAKGKGIKIYELDQEPIQQLKKQYLKETGLPQDRITFVSVDFNDKLWLDRLLETGFDTTKKTLFLWEGVASYLSETVVIKTLKSLKSISPGKSIICFDYNSKSYNEAKGRFMEKVIVRLMSMTGKTFLFGIDTSDAVENAKLFLSKCDLNLKDLTLIGRDTKSVHPFSGLIEAIT